MAVSPLPSRKRNTSAVVSSEKFKKLKKRRLDSGDSSAAQESTSPLPTLPRKRNTAPGVRVIGSRIYDDKNGKTCHQCRQKTMDFFAACKGTRNGKPCPICFCYKCLLNRYGEKAEEVAALDNWVCPKCRGVCNCSFCMKKRGEQPTGILVHTAKAVGFSSVLELLHHKGPLVACGDSAEKEVEAIPGDSVIPKIGGNLNDLVEDTSKGNLSASKKGPMKSKHEDTKMKINDSSGKLLITKKKSKRKMITTENDNQLIAVIQEKNPSCIADDNLNVDTVETEKSATKKAKPILDERFSGSGNINKKKNAGTKAKNSVEAHDVLGQRDVIVKAKVLAVKNKDKAKEQAKVLAVRNKDKAKEQAKVLAVRNKDKAKEVHHNVNNIKKYLKAIFSSRNLPQDTVIDSKENLELNPSSSELGEWSAQHAGKCSDLQICLPEGTPLTTVAGIDLPVDAVGDALQFLEFCAAFGKVLGLKRGQAEAVLRELSRVSSRRQGLQSSVVQFHVKLLSLIDKDSEDKQLASTKDSGTTWLQALGKHLTDCPALLKDFPPGTFNKGNAVYNNLDISKKLRLMNFLCDEILSTGHLRDWIENENLKFKEKKKEDKEEVLVAKEKERSLKQKLKDNLAQAMLAFRTGATLTVSEHDRIMSEIKRKTEEVHLEMKSSIKLPMKKQRSDALRTEPFMMNEDGQVFWGLKCYFDGTSILLQDIDGLDSLSSKDKWVSYAEEQQKIVEKYILHRRKLRLKMKNLEKRSLSSDDHTNNETNTPDLHNG